MWFLVTKLNNVSLWREKNNRRGGVEWRKRKSLLCLIPCGECFCSNKLLLPTNVRTEGQTKGGPGLCSWCSLCCWGLSSNSLRELFLCQARLSGLGAQLSTSQCLSQLLSTHLCLLNTERFLLHKPGNFIHTASRCLLMWDWTNSWPQRHCGGSCVFLPDTPKELGTWVLNIF